MTRPFSKRVSGPYTATANQTQFDYTFPISAEQDLRVRRLRAGAISTLALTTDYTVQGVGNQTGGTITLTAGSTAGDVLAIDGELRRERVTEFQPGLISTDHINAEFDALVTMIQELERDRAWRSILLESVDDDSVTLALPLKDDRIGGLLVFDANGNLGVRFIDGAQWWFQATPPPPGPLGAVEGDLVVVNDSGHAEFGNVYQLFAGNWVQVINLRGPEGQAGVPAGMDYNYNSAVLSGDPGAGRLGFSNFGAQTPSEGTLYISKTDIYGGSKEGEILRWDDSTTVLDRGLVRVVQRSDRSKNIQVSVRGQIADGGNHLEVPVHLRATGESIVDAQDVGVMFSRSGNTGAGTGDFLGPADSVSDELVLFAGTTGKQGKRPANGRAIAPRGTTAQRPTPNVSGAFRVNSTEARWEFWIDSGGEGQPAQYENMITHFRRKQIFSGGLTTPANNHGTLAGVTRKFEPGDGALQDFTLNGTLTIDPPDQEGSFVLAWLNGASAGAVTFPGSWKHQFGGGDDIDQTQGNTFYVWIMNLAGEQTYFVRAGQ